jgi:hypothetical protein
MVARGEIGLLVVQIGLNSTKYLSQDAFITAVWAIILNTIIGPVAVGFILKFKAEEIAEGRWGVQEVPPATDRQRARSRSRSRANSRAQSMYSTITTDAATEVGSGMENDLESGRGLRVEKTEKSDSTSSGVSGDVSLKRVSVITPIVE